MGGPGSGKPLALDERIYLTTADGVGTCSVCRAEIPCGQPGINIELGEDGSATLCRRCGRTIGKAANAPVIEAMD